MKCPKCSAAMELVVFEDVEVDRCSACRGIWLDSGELRRLEAARGAKAVDIGTPKQGRERNDQRRVPCPRCSTPMVRMVDRDQPHIWFESCSVCGGIYLDAGELRDHAEHTMADWFRSLFARERP